VVAIALIASISSRCAEQEENSRGPPIAYFQWRHERYRSMTPVQAIFMLPVPEPSLAPLNLLEASTAAYTFCQG